MKKKGRPPSLVITPETLKEIERMSGLGLTQNQLASYYGISRVTWHKMKNKDERLNFVVKKGKSKAIEIVAGKLMEKINAGNLSAMIFYLKTQAGWTEKNALVVDNKSKYKKIEYKINTDDPIEASKIYQSIMTGSYKDERNRTSK